MGLCFAAAAQQFKWVDQDGRVQYGDAPPPGVKATPLRAPSGPAPSAAPGAAPSATERDAEFNKRQLDAAKQRDKEAAAAQDTAAKKQNCAQAQAAVRSLDLGGRQRRLDANGEPYYMEDDQIAQERARAQKGVSDWCN